MKFFRWTRGNLAVIAIVVFSLGNVGAWLHAESADYRACDNRNHSIEDGNAKRRADEDFLVVLDEQIDLSDDPIIKGALDAAIAANRERVPKLKCNKPWLML